MINKDGTPRFELPDRGTLLVMGFFALLGFGMLGLLVPEIDLEPLPSASSGLAFAREQGTVVFGTATTSDCAVSDSADRFAPGMSVWWTAWLVYALEPGAEALLIVRHDGTEIDRVRMGSEQHSTSLALLCSEVPIAQISAGTYRVEIRDVSDSVTYAVGQFEVGAGSS